MKIKNRKTLTFMFLVTLTLTILVLCVAFTRSDPKAMNSLDVNNVVWDSPSTDQSGSMPIGNGDLAANVWVEPNGDLLFYLSKSDAWGDGQQLLKLGLIRVSLEKPLFLEGAIFKQELDLKSGSISITSTNKGQNNTILFWIDANQAVVNVEIKASKSFKAKVSLEIWRSREAEHYGDGNFYEECTEPDTLLPSDGQTIRWYHRNKESIFAESLKNQHLGHLSSKFPDPLINLTFGGLISGKGLESKDAKTLVTKEPTKNLHVRVHALTAQTETEADWLNQIEKQRTVVERASLKEARKQHEAWWAEFWSRSYIYSTGTTEADSVSSAYILQRWIQACAGRGAYPIKFNGSLFTVQGNDRGEQKGHDYRRWGGCYWFQNTRLIYWPMLYAGDLEQMEPLWKMYRDALPLLKERTRAYFNHEGIFCSETIYFWGLNRNEDFGIGNEGLYPTNPFIRYYWDSGNELSMMMLDYYEYTHDETFAQKTLIPIADEVMKFYDQHCGRNEQGKVLFSPAASLETWHVAEDPLPVVVGLQTVLTRLLELPESLTSQEQRDRWKRFCSELPEIPFGEENGSKWIKPARTYSHLKNSENPELYSIFPYRAYGIGKPDLEVALETWRRRRIKRSGGWTQDPIQAAMLGLTQEAKDMLLKNVKNRAPLGTPPAIEPRFPAFLGPNFDWIPDQDQGSVIMIALQQMLMQCEGKRISLLPAWPKEWDVEFKMHAPYNTTVEGRVEKGKLLDLKVTPESRRNDVIVMEN